MGGFGPSFESYLEGSLFVAYATVFMAGLLTSFTPCVYPMIPITVGVIGGSEKKGRLHAFLLSLAYVSGLAIIYAALGMIASLTGQFFGSISANRWSFLIVANIIILFGLSMLEVFTIPLPRFLQQGGAGSNKKGVVGAFLIGMASGLVAAPCTTPVLGVLLAYVATRQNVLYGATLLLTFSFGMNMLLLAIGTFTGLVTALPKSGLWMVRVKKGMGWLMIVIGQYFIIQAGKVW